jgi:hypothetical protein
LTEFDDIDASIFEWLPVIAMFFPGSGVTALTVYETPFNFWQLFVANAKAKVA